MAEIIPLEIPVHATRGEKQLFALLNTVLVPDAEFIVWFEPKPGEIRLRPDFLIWSQRMGLLIIEVKDWVIGQIEEMNATQCRIRRRERTEEHPSPTHQAYRYSLAYRDFLCKHVEFGDEKEGHKGEVKFPVGYCAAFTNIRREEAKEIAHVLGEASCLFADDLEIDVNDSGARLEFITKLRNAFSVKFSFDSLSTEELQTLRNCISPVFRTPGTASSGTGSVDGIDAGGFGVPTNVSKPVGGSAAPPLRDRPSSSRIRKWLFATAIVLWLTLWVLIRPSHPISSPKTQESVANPSAMAGVQAKTRGKARPSVSAKLSPERSKNLDTKQPSHPFSEEVISNSEMDSQPSILMVMIQQVRFTVTSCTASGNVLSCGIAVRSVKGDRELALNVHEYVSPTSRIVDSTGKEYIADSAKVGSRASFGTSAQNVLVEGIPLGAELYFHHVAPNIGSISLLEVAGEIGNQTFKAQFRRVPILSSASSKLEDGGSGPG